MGEMRPPASLVRRPPAILCDQLANSGSSQVIARLVYFWLNQSFLMKRAFLDLLWGALFFGATPFPVAAQSVLFDFDTAPIYTSLPLTLTVAGITAHFSATGAGYSIQPANTMGFTPA